jgi:hypothetical protein
LIAECAYSRRDLAPRVIVVHVVARDPEREVRSIDLRGVRLEDAIEPAWRRATRHPATVGEEAVDDPAPLFLEPEEGDRAVLRALRRPARRTRITDRHLDEVARVYRENRESGRPTTTVAEHFGKSLSMAGEYVARARKAGKDMGDEDHQHERS